jgi:hypothetical protein
MGTADWFPSLCSLSGKDFPCPWTFGVFPRGPPLTQALALDARGRVHVCHRATVVARPLGAVVTRDLLSLVAGLSSKGWGMLIGYRLCQTSLSLGDIICALYMSSQLL